VKNVHPDGVRVAQVLYPRWRYASFVLLSLAILVLHVLLTPYRLDRDNQLETATLLHLVALSGLLNAEAAPFSIGFEATLSVVVLVPVFAVFLLLVHDAVGSCRAKRAQKAAAKQAMGATSDGLPVFTDSPASPSSRAEDVTNEQL
jgi:hypothetical protein